MKDILLDTHIWIWITKERKESFTKKTKTAIKEARQKWISAISCCELAKLVEKKRISSRIMSMPVVTSDRRILDYSDVEVIW